MDAAHAGDLRIAGGSDVDEVVEILAAGFGDDPLMCWMFDEPGRAAKLTALFRFFAGDVYVAAGATWLRPGSCAVWRPPGLVAADDEDDRFLAAMLPVASEAELGRGAAVSEVTSAVHPHEPHWYLFLLATVPDRRGGGGGTALLERSLGRVDEDHLPAYLESTNPQNQSLYLRHGFEVTGTIDGHGGPPLTPMWRPAR